MCGFSYKRMYVHMHAHTTHATNVNFVSCMYYTLLQGMQEAQHQLRQLPAQQTGIAGGLAGGSGVNRASTSSYSPRMNDPRYIPMAELYDGPPPVQDMRQGIRQPHNSVISPPGAQYATDRYSTADSDRTIQSRRHEYMSIPALLPNHHSKGDVAPINQHSPPSDSKPPQSQPHSQTGTLPRRQAYDPYVPMSALLNSQDDNPQSRHPASEHMHMLHTQRTSEGKVQMDEPYNFSRNPALKPSRH